VTGLVAGQGGYATRPDAPPASEAARAELVALGTRRLVLPDLMREAAKAGRYDEVARLRLELEQLPYRVGGPLHQGPQPH
jgi:hypothetical protein